MEISFTIRCSKETDMKTIIAITCLFAGQLANAAEQANCSPRPVRRHSRISRRVKPSPKRPPCTPRSRVSPRRATGRHYTMIIIRPARHTQYTILRVKPNPGVKYQILRVHPHARKRVPRTRVSRKTSSSTRR